MRAKSKSAPVGVKHCERAAPRSCQRRMYDPPDRAAYRESKLVAAKDRHSLAEVGFPVQRIVSRDRLVKTVSVMASRIRRMAERYDYDHGR
jgi:hypothetical protein